MEGEPAAQRGGEWLGVEWWAEEDHKAQLGSEFGAGFMPPDYADGQALRAPQQQGSAAGQQVGLSTELAAVHSGLLPCL